MAYPLKSGADLYTQELLRARLHNFDGDLAEYGPGSIYFNTTSNLNTSNRVRYRGKTAWHSVANLEDITRLEGLITSLGESAGGNISDILNRVITLENSYDAFFKGEADSDAVLENLAELKKFLDTYTGDLTLSQVLNDINEEVAKKADKATTLAGYGITDALPLSGGTLTSKGTDIILTLDSDRTEKAAWVCYKSNGETLGYLGVNGKNVPSFYEVGGTTRALLHLGNYNTYSPKLDGTGATGTWGIDISGSADKANKLATARTIWGQSFDGSADVSGALSGVGNITMTRESAIRSMDRELVWANDSYCRFGYGYAWASLPTYIAGSKIYFSCGSGDTTSMLINSSGNVTIGASDLAGTTSKLYVDGNMSLKNAGSIYGHLSNGTPAQYLGLNAGNHLVMGWGSSAANCGTSIYGHTITLGGNGSSHANHLFLNTFGNVSIASWDAAEGNTRFYVYNDSAARALEINTNTRGIDIVNSTTSQYANVFAGYATNLTSGSSVSLTLGKEGSASNCAVLRYTHKGDSSVENFASISLWGKDNLLNILANGNIGIGTTAPAYKLDVNGNVGFNGTLTLPINHQVQWGDSGLMMYGSSTALTLVGNTEINGTAKIYGVANLSSRVLIGGATDDGATALQVRGGISNANGSSYLYGYGSSSATNVTELDGATAIGAGKGFWGIYAWAMDDGTSCLQSSHSNGATLYKLSLQPFGGNVAIGKKSADYKLDINGTLRATDAAYFDSTLVANGLITAMGGLQIANTAYLKIGEATLLWDSTNQVLKIDKNFSSDGQISSKGVAAEGSDEAIAGGSGLEKKIFSIPIKSKSFTCEHNLSTKEVSVSIYEDGNDYQQVSADVYLDNDNSVRIVFGPETDVVHKVVIIG